MGVLGNSVHTGIFAADIETMVAFYRDILGLETDYSEGPFAAFKVSDGGFFMFDRKIFANDMKLEYVAPAGINQTMEICLGVPHREDVDSEYRRITALGVPSLTGEPATHPWGQRNFWIADPEGNLIEIVC